MSSRLEYHREYYRKNAEKRRAYSREAYRKNPEYLKSWNKENKDKCRAAKRRYDSKKRLNPIFRLNAAVRTAIHNSLKIKKDRSWTKIVSFNLEQLKHHLESQFDSKMTWENYGSYWHIDHKFPISLSSFKECWQLDNLRPLEAIENIKKGNKIEVSKENFIRLVDFSLT